MENPQIIPLGLLSSKVFLNFLYNAPWVHYLDLIFAHQICATFQLPFFFCSLIELSFTKRTCL